MEKIYRKLTSDEINHLTSCFCHCDNWNLIDVVENFSPKHIRNVQFSGHIKLGIYQAEITFYGGIKRKSGIYDATLHNCTIGDNVYICNVKNYIANYVIEDDVVIDNLEILAVEGISSFGNGTQVATLNETGGRSVKIFDRLSAPLAYVMVMYRHRPELIQAINDMIDQYTEGVSSNMGLISKGAKLLNCRTIKNAKIGPYSKLDGVKYIHNGTLNSCIEDPIHVGFDIIAENFIASSGTWLTDGAIVSNCFIGQAYHLGKQYSAENSMFFANCIGFHGEACSIFAGPYTVTHHKSTLLIAGYFSFLNAGSGSNQSNHMYKLGPIHQGVVERGSKTTSDSYLLWPAKVGAFTLVMGRHYRNFDTSNLPFSYLIESNDESVLVPGANLRSVGTIRDAQKWPKRDNRKDPDKLDEINFNLLSPYTIQKMLKGIDVLKALQKNSGETSNFYSYQSAKINNSSLNSGLHLYDVAITKFLGNSLIKRLEITEFTNDAEIQRRLQPDTPIGEGEWLDLAGLIAPKSAIDRLLNDIEGGKIDSLENILQVFRAIQRNYYTYEWTWAIKTIAKYWKKDISDFTSHEVIDLVEKWRKSVIELDNSIYADAKKEFTLTSKTGFGVDGTESEKHLDFEQVRGEFENNSFVKEVKNHIKSKNALADEIINRMKKIV